MEDELLAALRSTYSPEASSCGAYGRREGQGRAGGKEGQRAWLLVACGPCSEGPRDLPAGRTRKLSMMPLNARTQEYPTPAMRALGMLCACGWPWKDPCRAEFRRK